MNFKTYQFFKREPTILSLREGKQILKNFIPTEEQFCKRYLPNMFVVYFVGSHPAHNM